VWWRSIKPSRAAVEAIGGAAHGLSLMSIGTVIGVRLTKINPFTLVKVIVPCMEHIDSFEMLQSLSSRQVISADRNIA
jgi:hypothetical protein